MGEVATIIGLGHEELFFLAHGISTVPRSDCAHIVLVLNFLRAYGARGHTDTSILEINEVKRQGNLVVEDSKSIYTAETVSLIPEEVRAVTAREELELELRGGKNCLLKVP